ncbi:hypothetical protein CQY22_007915 [Mycolicibacterium brumae]|uniref:Uncharacterized protein n=1 Tax=Mycolicibacterium brumae TaxID=85968 RepID=A0A2G5PD90_9MYCO|nr:hypothetical protein CQY22_007915 [Mycolicibacterium brumae]
MHRYRAANQHGGQMHNAIDILESAIPSTDATEVYTVTHKALASAITVIARADDSAGIIGDACRRLLALHPTTAIAAAVPPGKLVDWMVKFQFDGKVDYFELDPVAYAPALGDAGIAAYRARLDELRASLSAEPAEPFHPDPDLHKRWVLEWNDKRLAVLDHDIAAIIRTHARDRRVAAWFVDTAKAFAEIGEIDLAIDWAAQGVDIGPWHQSLQAAGYWCGLLAEHRPADELDARLTVFRRWPSSSTAAQLHRSASAQWPGYADEVMDTLSQTPREAVLFTLLTLKDPRQAWDLAQRLSLDSDDVWAELIKSYDKIDPAATLPIHRRLVEQQLIEADARHYRAAARRLAKMRKLAAGTDHSAEVDEFIADLRESHRRRPRLQQEFDRAGLP